GAVSLVISDEVGVTGQDARVEYGRQRLGLSNGLSWQLSQPLVLTNHGCDKNSREGEGLSLSRCRGRPLAPVIYRLRRADVMVLRSRSTADSLRKRGARGVSPVSAARMCSRSSRIPGTPSSGPTGGGGCVGCRWTSSS